MGRRDRQSAETIHLQQLLKIADGVRQLGQAAAMVLEAQLQDAGGADMKGLLESCNRLTTVGDKR